MSFIDIDITADQICLQVVLVEVCRDRVGLLMNPDSPRDLQLWVSRRLYVSGLPKAEGWPCEAELLSGTG